MAAEGQKQAVCHLPQLCDADVEPAPPARQAGVHGASLLRACLYQRLQPAQALSDEAWCSTVLIVMGTDMLRCPQRSHGQVYKAGPS